MHVTNVTNILMIQIHSRYDSCNQKAKIVKEIYTCLVALSP